MSSLSELAIALKRGKQRVL